MCSRRNGISQDPLSSATADGVACPTTLDLT
jgi:hypothetical protein